MFDIDTINQMNREAEQEHLDTRKLRNRIMAMRPGPRKTDMWQRNFPYLPITGEIIDSPVY